MKLVDNYATGDNWNEPYVSGYDNLLEKIWDDLDKFPHCYQDWEIALLEKDSLSLSNEDEERLREYIEDWVYFKSKEGF